MSSKMLIVNIAIFVFSYVVVHTRASCPTTLDVITFEDVRNAVHASSAIYDDNLLEGDIIPKTNFRVTKRFHDELHEDGAGIRVMVADHKNTRMIIYRGTDGAEQLLVQGSSVLKQEITWTVDGVDTKILTFFYNAYRLASYQLQPYLKDSSKHYILTGHSLGGALASILALDTTELFEGSVWKNPKSSLITFGQPRVGGRNYATVHDRLISTFRKLRFINRADPVPTIPGKVFGWRHHSRTIYIGTRTVYTGFGKRRRMSVKKIKSDSTINDEGKFIDFEPELVASLSKDIMELKEDIQKINKKFFRKSEYYWKVCGSGDLIRCKSIYNPVPVPTDHFILNYVDAIENPPSHIQTMKGTNKSTFQEALIGTCLNQ